MLGQASKLIWPRHAKKNLREGVALLGAAELMDQLARRGHVRRVAGRRP